MNISASLLAADFSRLKEEINKFSKLVDRIHIDAMDGDFVPNIAFGPTSISWIRRSTNLPLEIHLYFKNPEKYLVKYLEAGVDIILIHIEAIYDFHKVSKLISKYNTSFGIAINPNTSLSKINSIISSVDYLLLLLVNAGFGGQKILPGSIKRVEKVNLLREKENLNFEIIADGGINSSNFKQILKSGADTLVMGSAIFRNPNAKFFLKSIRKEIRS